MVVLDIYEKNIKVIYKTTLCSKAALFIFLTTGFTIIFTFIFAYNSRGFWLKHDTFYEQPNVKFRGEYLFLGVTSNASNIIVCNNFHYVQEFVPYDSCSMIKVREFDNNLDKIIDSFKFQMELNLPEKENLLYFTLLLSLDYRLRTTCPVNMQSAVILQQSLQMNVKELNVYAHLKLSQATPLYCHRKKVDNFHNNPILRNPLDASSYQIETIIGDYSNRNISTHLEQIYTTFTTSSQDIFKLNVQINYPEHMIHYTPNFWQIVKWAWIQYVAIYIITSWIVRKITNYVFENNLVLFYKMSPIK